MTSHDTLCTDPDTPPDPREVVLLGASGTIGQATAAALCAAGHRVTAVLRPVADRPASSGGLPAGCAVYRADVTRADALTPLFATRRFDAVVSCLASRTGDPVEAWDVDHRAHVAALDAARAAGVSRFVLLSALCVQEPELEFQRAKLAFETELMRAELDWSIVRPTAFFKSLSGQVARVAAGKRFVMFGDGRLTACKPISDADLGGYLAHCLTDPGASRRVLPIGGPGPAITPLDQAQMLFDLTGRPPRYRRVPVALMDGIVAVLTLAARLRPSLAAKAEFARIGRFYATRSMLVIDPATGRYSAEATPEWGSQTLRDHYAAMLRGEVADDRGAHAVF